MKTREQIHQILKDKLNVDDANTAIVIQLKEPIRIPITPVSSVILSAISYEKRTDTIWILGKNRKEPIKITLDKALDHSIYLYGALDKLTNEINTLPTELIDLPTK